MALTLHKKPRPNKSKGKRPALATMTPAQVRERYYELVRAAAKDGDEPDVSELADICFRLDLQRSDFMKAVKQLAASRDATSRLRGLDAAEAEIDVLRERIGENTGKLDTLRAEFYDQELPLVQVIDNDKDALTSLLAHRRQERADAVNSFTRNATLGMFPNRTNVEPLRQQRGKLAEELERLVRELARAEQHQRRVERLRQQFFAWRKGRPVDLLADANGKVKLPLWHAHDGAWGQLEAPTAKAVKECEARLEQFAGNCVSPQQVRDRLDECRQAIANIDAQIDEAQAEMLR